MKRPLNLAAGVLLLLAALAPAMWPAPPAQKIYWGDSIPSGWNGKWPAKYLTVADKLRAQGVKVEVLAKPVKASGEEYVVDKVGRGRSGGYSMIKLEGGFAPSQDKEFPAGTFRVDLAQPLANLAFYCLEPQAADGFVGWGVFEDWFKAAGADKRSVVYPVYKYLKIVE